MRGAGVALLVCAALAAGCGEEDEAGVAATVTPAATPAVTAEATPAATQSSAAGSEEPCPDGTRQLRPADVVPASAVVEPVEDSESVDKALEPYVEPLGDRVRSIRSSVFIDGETFDSAALSVVNLTVRGAAVELPEGTPIDVGGAQGVQTESGDVVSPVGDCALVVLVGVKEEVTGVAASLVPPR